MHLWRLNTASQCRGAVFSRSHRNSSTKPVGLSTVRAVWRMVLETPRPRPEAQALRVRVDAMWRVPVAHSPRCANIIANAARACENISVKRMPDRPLPFPLPVVQPRFTPLTAAAQNRKLAQALYRQFFSWPIEQSRKILETTARRARKIAKQYERLFGRASREVCRDQPSPRLRPAGAVRPLISQVSQDDVPAVLR